MLLLSALAILSSIPVAPATTCGEWDTGFAAIPTTGHRSAAVDSAWSALSDCDTFTLDHDDLCWNDGSTPPSTPSAADSCVGVESGKVARTVWVHRSGKQFTFRVFGCDDASAPCTDWYGLSSPESVLSESDVETATTDLERWVIEDVEDYDECAGSATDCRVVEGNLVSQAFPLHYPSGWTLADHLGVWWSDEGLIYFKRATSSGWMNWNTTTAWTSPALVAQEVPTSDNTFHHTSHPWLAAHSDGSTHRMRMWVNGGISDYRIFEVDSTDEAGSDFGLECTESEVCTVEGDTCPENDLCDWTDESGDGDGVARESVCTDGSSTCHYLDEGGNGAIAWDYVANQSIEFSGSDTPQLVFTGCDTVDVGSADILQMTWDPGDDEWDLHLDGSYPEEQVESVHDPSVIALPGGEYKMYYKDNNSSPPVFKVIYWDGTAWGDEQEIEIYFDDGGPLGTTETDYDCHGNMKAWVWVDGASVPHEGAMIKAMSTDGCTFDPGGIVFIEHRN